MNWHTSDPLIVGLMGDGLDLETAYGLAEQAAILEVGGMARVEAELTATGGMSY